MDFIIEKFKKAERKKQAIYIVIAVIIVLAIFGRLKSSLSKKTDSAPVTTTTVTVSQTEAETETTSRTTTVKKEMTEKETTDPESEETEEDEEKEEEPSRTGIRKDFKDFWDSYVKFMDTYVDAMKNPDSANYIRVLADYAEFTDKATDWEDSDDLSDEEIKYMTAAQAKITAKYVEAALSS